MESSVDTFLDSGGRDFIEFHDFKTLCVDLNMTDDALENTFMELDTDSDGKINFEDFENGFQKVMAMMSTRSNNNNMGEVSPLYSDNVESRDEVVDPLYGNEHLLTYTQFESDIITPKKKHRILPRPDIDPHNRELLDNVTTLNSGYDEEHNFVEEPGEAFSDVSGTNHDVSFYTADGSFQEENVYDSEEMMTPWETFCRDNAAEFSTLCPKSQEQVCEFYQQLHASEFPGVLGQFESIILGVIKDIRTQQQENTRLENSFKREKEHNERHLQQLEEELDNQMQKVSSRVKEEEQEKHEREIAEIRSLYEREREELENNLHKLQTIHATQPESSDRPSDEQFSALRNKIDEVSHENRYLKSDLTDAQTNLALVRSELATLRQELSDKCSELSSEKQTLVDCVREQENLSRQLHMLHDANKKLHDTNDDLRAALEASRHARARTSKTSQPTNHSTPVQDVPRRPSSQNSLADEISQSEHFPSRRHNVLPSQESCEVDSLPDDFDSGHSTLRDINEIDSEEETNIRPSRQLKRSGHSADSDDTDTEIEKALQRSYDSEIPKTKRRRERMGSRPNSADSRSSMRSQRSNDSSGSVRRKLPTPPISRTPVAFGEPERMYKVVLAGDAAVGKTSFIMRLCKGSFVTNISSTLGVDFHTKVLEVDGRTVALQLWDTAGQERFRSIAKSYFRRADGVLLLYDCTYERSFLNVREWVDAIEDGAQKKIPIMMCANKKDLREVAEAQGQKVVTYDTGSKLAKDYSALFIETSAKDGSNITASVTELTRMLRTNEDLEVKSVGLQLHEMQIDNDKKLLKCC